MNPISVLVIDDNPTFLRVVTRFLKEHKEIKVVGSFSGAEEALGQIHELRPDVVLIDLAMPKMSGMEGILRLRAVWPQVQIIALTLMNTSSYRQAALSAGADEFVPKDTLNTDLLPAIHQVVEPVKVDR